MEVQLGWFYQTRDGSVVRIKGIDELGDAALALVVMGRQTVPWGLESVTIDGRTCHRPIFSEQGRLLFVPPDQIQGHACHRIILPDQPRLILESGSWLHDLTAAWKSGDGILAERLKEAGRKVA